ncbi:MAG TPA: hypothetical protein VJB57_18500 [Dehalococcoidia bacterium]|nr:hypothetical protein [Dehalococcoidia bacterium]
MFQADQENLYDDSMEATPTPEASWTEAIRTAVKDFVSVVGESATQLASAAENFAGESLKAVDEAADKAGQAAITSSEMATTATQAAAEARSIADGVTQTASAVADETRDAIEQANQAAAAASEQARQAVEAIEQSSSAARLALNEASSTAFDSINQSVASAIESLNSAATAAAERLREEAREIAEQLTADVVLQAREALDQIRSVTSESQHAGISPQAQEALDQIRSAAADSQSAVAAAQQAAMEARTAANDSLAHSERALEVAASPTVGAGAQEVLERLEADYDLLTRLVQELHTRIVNLTAPPVAPAVEVPDAGLSESYEQSWEPEPELEPVMASEPEAPTPIYQSKEEEPAYDAPVYEEPEPAYVAPVTSAPQPVEEIAQPTVAGRVMVTIAPVPDFDRLLNLDGALGRMRGIVNVSLADYAKEEVTFRLEVESPMSADDFARSLSESAGSSASVAGTEEGKIALRLAS